MTLMIILIFGNFTCIGPKFLRIFEAFYARPLYVHVLEKLFGINVHQLS